MTSNPLVATAATGPASDWTGFAIAEDVEGLHAAISSKSWIDGGLAAFGTALDAVSLAVDPFGTLLSWGFSWLMEHVSFLREPLDWLAGKPQEIAAHAATWRNVSASLAATAQEHRRLVAADLTSWSGAAADAYRTTAGHQAEALGHAATMAETMAMATEAAGVLVGAVRDFVRDAIAELMAKLVVWAAEAAASFGFATPWIAVQAETAAVRLGGKLAKLITRLIESIRKLMPLLRKLQDLMRKLGPALAKLGRRADSAVPTSSAAHAPGITPVPVSHKVPSAPPVRRPAGAEVPDPPPRARAEGGPGAGTPDGGPGRPVRDPGSARTSQPTTDAAKTGDHSRDAIPPKRTCTNDPVDIATGEMLLVEGDVLLPGVLPLELGRTHLSSWRWGRHFGPTWASTLDARLDVDDDGVTLVGAAAMLVRVALPSPDGRAVVPPDGDAWELARYSLAGGDVTARVPAAVLDHAREVAVDGELWGAREPDGARRTWWFARSAGTADTPGSRTADLLGLTDPGGSWWLVDHRDGVPAAVRHSGGYELAIDSAGGLITAIHLVDGGQRHLIRTFTYDDDARLTRVGDPDDSEHAFTYDAQGRMTGWEDRLGFWYRYEYDDLGRAVRAVGLDGVMSCSLEFLDDRVTLLTDSTGAVTRYEFDEQHLLRAVMDPLGGRTEQEWDARRRLVRRVDAAGAVTTWRHDAYGRLLETVLADGATTTVDRDGEGRVVRRTDPDGSVTELAWADGDRLVEVRAPGGAVHRFGHDPASGAVTSVTDPLGATTVARVDAAGLPVAVTDPLGATDTYERDRWGHVVAWTDALGAVTRWQRDEGGRPLVCEHPDGSVERWGYDLEGHLVEHTGPTGAVTRYEIGPFGTVTGRADADGASWRVRYDTELRPVEVLDARGLSWRYAYDAAGRLAETDDYDGVVTRYERDAVGRVVREARGVGSPDEVLVALERDLLGRAMAVSGVPARASGPVSASVRYEYDVLGRAVVVEGEDHRVELTYDAADRLVEERVDGRALRLSYDLAGNVVGRTLPDGTTSSWTYDAVGSPSSLLASGAALRFEHDALGRLVGTGATRGGTSGAGDVGVQLSQSFDAMGRLTAQAVTAARPGGGGAPGLSGASAVLERAYQWRSDGYVTGLRDSLLGERGYDLDAVGRVTSVGSPGGASESYAYDRGGSLTSASWSRDGAEAPTAAGGREYQRSQLRRAGRTSYDYDGLGRLVSRVTRTLSGKVLRTSFTWDALDRLVSVTTPAGDVASYTYDGLARRVTKSGPSGQVTFVWDGPRLVAETTPDGSRSWEYLPGTHTPVTQTWTASASGDAEVRFLVTDTVGTVVHLVDVDDGRVTWSRRASLWGARGASVSLTGPDGCPLDHPGQYVDSESGLHYNYFRYYDPANATYVSPDPLGLAPALNHRTYPLNPSAWLDDTGLKGHRASGSSPSSDSSPACTGNAPKNDDDQAAPRFTDNSSRTRTYGSSVADIKAQANRWAERQRRRGFKAEVPPVRYGKYGYADVTVRAVKGGQEMIRHFIYKRGG